jgi:hypothetical protein
MDVFAYNSEVRSGTEQNFMGGLLQGQKSLLPLETGTTQKR